MSGVLQWISNSGLFWSGQYRWLEIDDLSAGTVWPMKQLRQEHVLEVLSRLMVTCVVDEGQRSEQAPGYEGQLLKSEKAWLVSVGCISLHSLDRISP